MQSFRSMDAEATEPGSTKHDDRGDDPPEAGVPKKKKQEAEATERSSTKHDDQEEER